MKTNVYKILLVWMFIFFAISSYGQTYLISSGGTINTCSGTLYDSGGPTGNYSNNENYTITICSNMPGAILSLEFTQFTFESPTWDHLSIFDGPNTSATELINNAGNSTPSGQIIVASGT